MPADERTIPQRIQLEDDAIAYVEILQPQGREEIGVLDAIPFDEVTRSLGGIARGIGAVIRTAKPDKASVELGVEFSMQEGKLVSVIARGEGKANMKLTLEWSSSE